MSDRLKAAAGAAALALVVYTGLSVWVFHNVHLGKIALWTAAAGVCGVIFYRKGD